MYMTVELLALIVTTTTKVILHFTLLARLNFVQVSHLGDHGKPIVKTTAEAELS
jgi:hypothetical protein